MATIRLLDDALCAAVDEGITRADRRRAREDDRRQQTL